MLLPDFKAAQLCSPGGRNPDPSWLAGIGNGRPAFLLGGAGGLVESPGLLAARNQIVIGSNWTLRALVPTIWTVFDADVWKSERQHLDRCADSLVVLTNKKIFGGGSYSVAGGEPLRWVGRRRWPTFEVTIKAAPGGVRGEDGVYRNGWEPPYLPKKLTDPLHPTGNSVGYMVQIAHLMGCNPIYLLGFTLMSGTAYYFGTTNPATGRRSFYSDPGLPVSWLKWYSSGHPGRLKLWPGWQGPINDAVETLDVQEARRLAGQHEPRHESNS